MGDTNSAAIFGDIFDYLAQQPDQRARDMALVFFKKSQGYDFCDDEMQCDEALIELRLARWVGKGNERRIEYGPEKS